VSPLLVLDAFALLAMFKAEPGGPRVRELIQEATMGEVRLVMASVNLGEVFYKTVRQSGLERAKAVLAMAKQFPIEFPPVDQDLALAAAEIKGVHRISYADCIAAALTQRLGATLVTGDTGFEQIADLRVEWLPK
jgi:predicted nucleic acid-binding protein